MSGFRTSYVLLVCLSLAPFQQAIAHKPSDSYLRLTSGEEALHIEWDIAIKDLEFLVGVDRDQDGSVTWGELKHAQDSIVAHALSRLRLSADGRDCELQLAEMLVTEHSDGGYAVLQISTDADRNPKTVAIEYGLLFDEDPTHRGLVLFEQAGVTTTHILSPDAATVMIKAGNVRRWDTLVDYIVEGVWHIWIGFDHILFLLSLLLPAVLIRREDRWEEVEGFGPACRAVLKIVTVFTIAHSMTLWLAVMEYVALPGQWVEATIAASIIITALNNLFPVFRLSGWAIAFAFGLVHGFGFANVLTDLGLSSSALAISLLGFNVGVELGQIAIVLVFLPLAYLQRKTWWYRRFVFYGGSVLIALIATVWFYERTANVEILGF